MSIGKWRRRLTKVHNAPTKFFKYCYLKLKRKLKKIEKLIKKLNENMFDERFLKQNISFDILRIIAPYGHFEKQNPAIWQGLTLNANKIIVLRFCFLRQELRLLLRLPLR